MPAVGTEKLVASQIGTDVVINVEHLKLAVQHAFVKGANDTNGDIEKKRLGLRKCNRQTDDFE